MKKNYNQSVSCCFMCRNLCVSIFWWKICPQKLDFPTVCLVFCLVPLVSSDIKHHRWLYWLFFLVFKSSFHDPCRCFCLVQVLKILCKLNKKFTSAENNIFFCRLVDKKQISRLSTGWSDFLRLPQSTARLSAFLLSAELCFFFFKINRQSKGFN